MVTEIRKGIYGIETEAFGADPSQIDRVYQFRYRVVGLDDVIPSHNDNLTPNSDYPAELQPRLRDRAASRTQIVNMAKNLNPRALLQDSGFIDTGPMIVGDDLVVESGNGRVLALRKASQDFPEQYNRYKKMLEAMVKRLGIDDDRLAKIDNPVLVRERLSQVDRVKFAAEANVGTVMAMSPYEQALQDAGTLSPNVVSTLVVGEEQTIDQALRMRSNDHIIKHFVSNIPATGRASIADEKGAINQQGIERLKLAIFAKTYTGDAGRRLVRIFGESADPMVKSIENAMFASLPDMAKAEGLIDAKQREADLSIAPDMAEVIDTYAGLKATELTVKDYLVQQAMFEERLSPFQKKLLEHLDDIARKPKLVREMLRDVGGKIVDAPTKGQIGMMGLAPLTKEAMVYGVINRQREELGKPTFQVTTTTTKGKELEKPDTGGIESAGRLGQAVGLGAGEDTGLAARTSVQVGLAGLSKKPAQVKMLEEFGGAPGAGGKKETLIDVEAEKAKEAAKPLPGQIVLEVAKEPSEIVIKEGIQKAVAENSYRLEHGWKDKTTGFTGFWITKRGDIYQHNKLRDIPVSERQGLINVHSHSPIGWERRLAEGKLDAFDSPNAGDVENLQNSVKNGWSDTMVVIMGDGRMEVLRVPDEAKASFLALPKTEIRKSLQLSYEERLRIHKDTGLRDYEIHRNALRQFAEKHGLEHKAELFWKSVAPEVPKAEVPEKVTKQRRARRVKLTIKKVKPTRSELEAIQESRTKRAQLLDLAKPHGLTIRSNSPKVGKWIKDQGNADIKGIDTPKAKQNVDWSKVDSQDTRRSNALRANKGNELATSEALLALASASPDIKIRRLARKDADYFLIQHMKKTIEEGRGDIKNTRKFPAIRRV